MLEAGVELPYAAIRTNIADAVQLILYIGRYNGSRRAAELIGIEHDDASQERYDTNVLYSRT